VIASCVYYLPHIERWVWYLTPGYQALILDPLTYLHLTVLATGRIREVVDVMHKRIDADTQHDDAYQYDKAKYQAHHLEYLLDQL